MRQVTMLSGDGGLGKSLAALQLMVATATDKPWLGLTTMPCKSFGVFCEDEPEEIWRRLDGVCRSYGVEFGDLEDMRFVSRVGRENSMLHFDKAWEPGAETDFYAQVMNQALDFGAQLVIVDSLHDVFSGDENRRAHARQFIGTLRTIATEINGAVLLTAHPSLNGRNTGSGEAGSTAWNNAVRSRLYLKRENGDTDDADGRVLETMKANYGPSGGRVRLVWRDGAFVPRDSETGLSGSLKRQSAEKVFLELLEAALIANRHVSATANAGNYAPRQFGRSPNRNGFNRKDFEAAMERLFADRRIKVEPYGRKGDERRGIVLAGT